MNLTKWDWFFIFLALALVALAMAMASGCTMPQVRGSEHRASMERFDTEGRVLERREVVVSGAVVSGEAVKDLQLPETRTELDGLRTSSGALLLSGLRAAGGVRILYVLGGVGILAGAVLGYVIAVRLGLMVGLAGVACIALATVAEMYPWLLLAPVALLVIAGGWLLWRAWDAQQKDTALRAVVKGVERAGGQAARRVKDAVRLEAGRAESRVKRVVDKVKNS